LNIDAGLGDTEILIDVDPAPCGQQVKVTAQFKDRSTGTPFQNKPVTFNLNPPSLGTILSADPKTNTAGYAICFIQPIGDGPATLTVTYDENGESASQSIYMCVTPPPEFTAFKNCGYSGIDVDWNSTGELVAFATGTTLNLVHNVPNNPSFWMTKSFSNINGSSGVVFAPSGDDLFFAGLGGTGELIRLNPNYPNGPISFVWNPPLNLTPGSIEDRCVDWGNYIGIGIVTSGDDAIVYLNPSSGTEYNRGITEDDDDPRAVAFNPANGSVCAVIDHDGNIYQFNGSSMIKKTDFGTHGRSAAWSTNGQHIAFGGDGGKVAVYDSSFSNPQNLSGLHADVDVVEFSPDDKWLVAAESTKSFIYENVGGVWQPYRSGPGGAAAAWDPTSKYIIFNTGDLCAPFDTNGPIFEDIEPPSGSVIYANSVTMSGDITDPLGVSSATITVNSGTPESLVLARISQVNRDKGTEF